MSNLSPEKTQQIYEEVVSGGGAKPSDVIDRLMWQAEEEQFQDFFAPSPSKKRRVGKATEDASVAEEEAAPLFDISQYTQDAGRQLISDMRPTEPGLELDLTRGAEREIEIADESLQNFIERRQPVNFYLQDRASQEHFKIEVLKRFGHKVVWQPRDNARMLEFGEPYGQRRIFARGASESLNLEMGNAQFAQAKVGAKNFIYVWLVNIRQRGELTDVYLQPVVTATKRITKAAKKKKPIVVNAADVLH
jgi:hypothetical protein